MGRAVSGSQTITVGAGFHLVVENVTPAVPYDPFFGVFLDSRKSEAGVDVNHYTALSHPPLLHGVTIIAGDIGQLPMQLKRHRNGRQDVITDHAGGRVARHRIDPRVSRNNPMEVSSYRETMMNHALIEGNGVAFIDRDQRTGQAIQQIPLPPYPMTGLDYDFDGELRYWTHIRSDSGGTEKRWIDPIDVFHIKGLSHDGLWGYRLIDIARDQIGHGIAIRTHGASSFANDQVPSGVISHPGAKLSADARDNLRRGWFAKHGSASKVGNIALLPQHMTYTPITFSNEDAQLIEALEKDRELQAELLNIPKFMLGIGERPGFTTQQLYQFYLSSCLGRWLNKWSEQSRLKLLSGKEIEQEELQFEFDTTAFRLVDFEKRVAAVNRLVGGPVVDRDEGRAMMGMNPAEDSQVFLDRSTGAPLGDEGGRPENPDRPRNAIRDNQIVRRLLANELKGIARTESQQLSAAAAKETDFDNWARVYYGEKLLNRLRDVVSEDTARRYCSERHAEVREIMRQDAPDIEKDLRAHRERGGRLLNYEIGPRATTNGQTSQKNHHVAE